MAGHPYDSSYLQDVVETQGALFERLQDDAPNIDGIDFIRSYMKSATRAHLDRGDAYLATMDARDLMSYYVATDRQPLKNGVPLVGFKPNWMGQFYARYQWESGLPSLEIVDKISPEWLSSAYYGLHDLDLPLAVEKVRTNLI